jgi:N-methylhydantoinase B
MSGFFACTAHIVDIGGRGFGADANSVYEEGLYIPIIKLAERGTVNDTLIAIVRGNVREPDQVVGDIYALATCNEVGHRRLVDMMDEFGWMTWSGSPTSSSTIHAAPPSSALPRCPTPPPTGR